LLANTRGRPFRCFLVTHRSLRNKRRLPSLREAAEQWFANKMGMKLRPATLSCYRVNLDRHILRADFADARLDKIGVGDVTAFRNRLAAKPTGKKKGRTLAAKTVNYVMRQLNAVFTYAMKARLAGWNPVASVDRLKQGSDEHDEDGGVRTDCAVTEDEVLSPRRLPQARGRRAGGLRPCPTDDGGDDRGAT
jgi:hypothetical protein